MTGGTLFRRGLAASFVFMLVALVGAACGGGSSTSSSSSGNGVASESAEQIFQATKTATQQATSARIFGTVHDNNQAIALNVNANNGGNGQGSLTVSAATVQLRKLGDTIYLLGDRTFYEKNVGADAANLLAGRWLQTTAADARFGKTAQLFDQRQLLSGVFRSVETSELTKGSTSTVRGQPVVEIKDSHRNSLWVATSGPAYLLKASNSKDNLELADFNRPVEVVPPPNAFPVPAR